MAVVHHRVHAGDAELVNVVAIHLGGLLVGAGGLGIIADAHVDVGWHVDEMARSGRDRLQPVGRGQSTLRRRRSLDGVDVVVIGADVVGVAAQHAFQNRDDRLRPLGRFAVQAPQLPWPQVHRALGVQHGGIEIRARPDRLPVRPRGQRPGDRLYETIGMEHVLDYRSLLF